MLEKHGRNIFEVTPLEYGGKKLELICRINPWIKVEDILPPRNRAILCVVMDDTYGDSMIYYAYEDPVDKKHFEGWTYDKGSHYLRRLGVGNFYRHIITHWMELPEVPNEVD